MLEKRENFTVQFSLSDEDKAIVDLLKIKIEESGLSNGRYIKNLIRNHYFRSITKEVDNGN